MTVSRLTALLLSGIALLAGCQSPAPTAPAGFTGPTTMPSADKVAAYREKMTKLKPGSVVGTVVANNSNGNLAAVADFPVKDFQIGQTLAFVDSDGNPINNGTIRNIVNDILVVQYDATGTRAPLRGDLALWLKE